MRTLLLASVVTCACASAGGPGGAAAPAEPSSSVASRARVTPPGSPSRVAMALADAIEHDDPQAAYAWLHPRVQAIVGLRELARAFRDNRAELRELAELLRARELETRAVAEVWLPAGELATLVWEPGGWRMTGALFEGAGLATPQDAVVAFGRALRRRDLPSLLRVLSARRRALWEAALGRGLDVSGDALGLVWDVRGERAVGTAADGTRIYLQKEAGSWHVADVRAPSEPGGHAGGALGGDPR